MIHTITTRQRSQPPKLLLIAVSLPPHGLLSFSGLLLTANSKIRAGKQAFASSTEHHVRLVISDFEPWSVGLRDRVEVPGLRLAVGRLVVNERWVFGLL